MVIFVAGYIHFISQGPKLISLDIIKSFAERYQHIHPVAFRRSVERAKSAGDLFDILESFPRTLPVVWNEQQRRWEKTKDLVQVNKFDFIEENDV